ncbi:polyketide synthase PksJ [Asanoa ishikariensis]|uniref:Polyketide synthase PksJ n=1 Tax=Asanoa ishikariensis TaxID=137265 RepID=A0A1H3T9B7_9ACTN|nr:amino acid adenylation domain-containing protein [Asanoa ishikariensis]SDZ46923.1 polyketide synthase PksJ [Asanoa ishikariensis]
MRDLSGHLAAQLAADRAAPAAVGDVTLTYQGLADRVDALAGSLEGHVTAGDVVALDIRSPVLGLVASLATDRLGAAYLPLDTAAPAGRQRWVVENAAARVVVHQTGPLALEPRPVTATRPAWPLTDPGYVIYTSGTTGRPKGVHVPKRSLVERLDGLLQLPGLRRGGSILAMSPLSFDMSVVELHLPLAAGGTMVTVDPAARRDVDVFDRAVREHRPDVVQATPSFFRLMIASGWRGNPDVALWCGGEALTDELANALHERCGTLWNMYGPTEATVWASACRLAPGQPISLGTDLPGTAVELVDQRGRVLTAAGAEGEIRISGAGIADGYLDATPTETARFAHTATSRTYLTGDRARRADDGSLTFVGRLDNQVKVRGHRVELGEVESTLESHPAVTEAVVVLVDQGDPDTTHLSAAVVTRGGVRVRDLRAWLAERLPAPMLPSTFQVATALPRTSAGKLDRVMISKRLSAGERLS